MLEFDEIVDRFDCMWRQSNPVPTIADFLRATEVPTEHEFALLQELISVDLEYRWRKYHSPTTDDAKVSTGALTVVDTVKDLRPNHLVIESYAEDWPEYSEKILSSIELIAEEFRVRCRWGDRPSLEVYLSRFGDSEQVRAAIFSVMRDLQLEQEQLPAAGSTQAETSEDSESAQGLVSIKPGDQFGRYFILEPIGYGGMGEVFLADDTQLERRVALKIPSLDASENARNRFVNEAKAAANLHHPGICPVFDAGEINGHPYITMAYIDGQTLRDAGNVNGGISVPILLSILADVARAMQVAHDAGIVHRDLKPTNVMIDNNGKPVVMDFGLARRANVPDDAKITRTGDVFGSPAYMSPEQVDARHGDISPATDIYSLGTILYEYLAYRLPFKGPVGSLLAQITRDQPPKPSDVKIGIDARLEQFCLKMLSKGPNDRPGSMTEVADTLTAIAQRLASTENAPSRQTQPIDQLFQQPQVQQVPLAYPVTTPKRQPRWGLIAGILLPLFVLLGVIVFRLKTPMGTVEVQVDDTIADQVQVLASQNGRVIKVADNESGWSLKLSEGVYEFELGTGTEEFAISPRRVTVTQGQTELVRVSVAKIMQPTPETLPEEAIETERLQPVHGRFLVRWEESTGNQGDIEYTFRADGRVLKADRPIGEFERREDRWIVDYDETVRGTVVLSHFTPNSFRGLHTWADGKTATWTATNTDSLEIQLLDELNTNGYEEGAWPSADGLRLYYEGSDDSTGGPDVLIASRTNRNARFTPVGSVASPARHPSLTADELTLVCLGGVGNKQLCEATRESRDDTFPTPQPIPEFIETQLPKSPWISADGLTLVFQRNRPGEPLANSNSEFVVATRDTRFDHWKPAKTLNSFGGTPEEPKPTWPSLSEDGLMMWYARGGNTDAEIWFAQRDSTNQPFDTFEPFRLQGQVLKGRSPRFCVTTGELFYSVNTSKGKWDLAKVSVPTSQAEGESIETQPTENYALHFTDALQYIETPVELDETQSFTIECWVAAVSPWEQGHVISNMDHGYGIDVAADSGPSQLWKSGFAISGKSSGGLYINKPERPPTHLALVWDGHQLSFYVDGDTDNARNIESVTAMPKFRHPLYLGTLRHYIRKGVYGFAPISWHQFLGIIDEVRISSVARYTERFNPARRHDPDEHTLALYHCDENGGKTLIDASGNENHGKITGDITWVPSYQMAQPGRYDEEVNEFERLSSKHTIPRTGPAVVCATRGTVIEVPPIEFDFTQPATVEFWATPYADYQPTSNHSRILVNFGGMNLKTDPRNNYYWSYVAWKTALVDVATKRKESIAFERRTHIAAQWDGERISMFVNGQPVPGPQYVMGSINVKEFLLDRLREANGKEIRIGSYGKDSQFGGHIDRFRLSNKVRYTEPFEPTAFEADADTLVMYDFHEGQGDTLHDLSGNDYHAKIIGGQWLPAPPKVQPLPGLIAEPAERKNIHRWQVETRWPRTQPVFHNYSLDGSYYAVGSRDGYVRIFEDGPHGELKCLIPADDTIKQREYVTVRMSWAPDGQRFVTATTTGWVRVWDITGQMLAEWQADLLDVEWSPSGEWIAGADGTEVRLWKPDGTAGAMLRMFDRHHRSHSVSWSPDGQKIATALRYRILVADTEGNVLHVIQPASAVIGLEWSPSGDRFATLHFNGTLIVWRKNGELIGGSHVDYSWSRDRIAFDWSPDGSSFAVINQEHCQLFSADGQPVWKEPSGQYLGWGENLTWKPEGSEIQAIKIDRDIMSHRVIDGQGRKIVGENPPRVPGMAWNAKHGLLCSATIVGNSLRLFDERGVPQGPFLAAEPDAYDCNWNHDGLLTASGTKLKLFPLSDDRNRLGSPRNLGVETSEQYRQVAAHPTKNIVAATRFWSKKLDILDGDGQFLKILSHPAQIDQLVFSPDGDKLAFTSRSEIVFVDCEDWEVSSKISAVYPQVAWSSDSKRLAVTNGSTGQVQIYSEDGTVLKAIDPVWSQGKMQACSAVAWSPNDRRIIWSRNTDVCCHDLKTQATRSLSHHIDDVEHAAWIDNERFITASDDGTVTAWNADTGKPLWIIVYVMDNDQNMHSVTYTATGHAQHSDSGAFDQLVYVIEPRAGQFQLMPRAQADGQHPIIGPAVAEH